MTTPPLDYSHVPRLLAPATNLVGAQTVARAVSFPASGGVQFVDATGAVVNPATLTGAALLAATQTFTGFNTFAPGNATRAAGSASFIVDMSAIQTLSATFGVTQIGASIAAPVFDTVGGQPDLDAAITLYISGPPTGSATTTASTAALYVASGSTLLGGSMTCFGTALLKGNTTIEGNLAFQNGYTITDAETNSPIVTTSGLNYTVQVRSTGILALDGGATGSVSVGVTAGSKVGFYATPPVALQTGVLVTAAGIHAALVNLGLITA